ncbi:MAG: DNA primase [Thermodesulfobacteriota bacterium]
MAEFQDNDVQLVKDAADIVEVIGEHVSLQRRGSNHLGLCPFHGEKTPSFTVSAERGLFHCFGCKESGDVISFMMKYHNLSFQDALQDLARRYGIALQERQLSPREKERARQRQRLIGITEKAAAIFHLFLLENPAARQARDYLEERGIPQQVIRDFRLGYAPDSWDFLGKKLAANPGEVELAVQAGLIVTKENGRQYDRFRQRLLCPIFNPAGQVVGFGGRILGDGQPKYLNSPESLIFDKSTVLYGLYQAREALRRQKSCVLVEGNFDLLAMVAQDMANVVAPLGTALTQKHVRLLKRYVSEAVLLFDGDAAGIKAAQRSVTFFLQEQLPARVAVLPPEHDPDTFLKEFGRQALAAEVAKAQSLPEFIFSQLVAEHGLGLEGKGAIVRELQPLLRALVGDQIQRTVFLAHFSEKLGIGVDDLSRAQVQRVAEPRPARTGAQPALPPEQRRLLEFLVFFPDHIEPFVAAGVEQLCSHPVAAAVMPRLKDLAGPGFRPEQLLAELDTAAQTLITEILVSPPPCLPDKAGATAQEMLAWILKRDLGRQKELLVARINEAHQANNMQLLMELLEKKKQLDEA